MTKAKKDETGASVSLVEAKRACNYLRWDLQRLGYLTFDDPLWALLEKKERELDEAMMEDIQQLGEGDAK